MFLPPSFPKYNIFFCYFPKDTEDWFSSQLGPYQGAKFSPGLNHFNLNTFHKNFLQLFYFHRNIITTLSYLIITDNFPFLSGKNISLFPSLFCHYFYQFTLFLFKDSARGCQAKDRCRARNILDASFLSFHPGVYSSFLCFFLSLSVSVILPSIKLLKSFYHVCFPVLIQYFKTKRYAMILSFCEGFILTLTLWLLF